MIEKKISAFLPCIGIFEREFRRIFTIPFQTLGAPLISSLLYFMLFGLMIGRLAEGSRFGYNLISNGFNYIVFLTPGLMLLETINASIQNPMGNYIISKWNRSILYQLMAPLTPTMLILGYFLGSFFRGFIVACSVFLAGCICAGEFIIPENISLALLSIVMCCFIFTCLGIIFGQIFESFDYYTMLMSLVMQPLMFFSGIFYSYHILPESFQFVRFFNPIYFLVTMFRQSILGLGDTSFLLAFFVVLSFAIASYIVCHHVVKNRIGLKF